MPIIEQVSVDEPLSQGDILRAIPLFVTEKCWEQGGGKALPTKHRYCLVISRPCALAHKEYAAIVPIEQYKGNVPGDVKTFDDLLTFLRAIRDGIASPDVFYLGEIDGEKGKFCARLDSFHTIELPEDQGVRTSFVKDSRVGRLSIDFARDLHVRLFNVFASLGFNDVEWFSDEDLNWAIEKGRIEVAEAERNSAEKKSAKSQKGFEGAQFPEAQVKAAEDRVTEIRAKLVPFEVEYQRRQARKRAQG